VVGKRLRAERRPDAGLVGVEVLQRERDAVERAVRLAGFDRALGFPGRLAGVLLDDSDVGVRSVVALVDPGPPR